MIARDPPDTDTRSKRGGEYLEHSVPIILDDVHRFQLAVALRSVVVVMVGSDLISRDVMCDQGCCTCETVIVERQPHHGARQHRR